jgi:heat shock protein HslJ
MTLMQRVVLVSLAFIFMSGCVASPHQGQTATPPIAASPSTAPSQLPSVITGTVWQLVSYADAGGALIAVPDWTAVTAVFGANEQFTGSAGCHKYAASYHLADSVISLGPLVTTKTACSVPQKLMTQEDRFLALLPSVRTVSITDGRLSLKDEAGSILLVFSPALTRSSLTGTSWLLDSYAYGNGGLIPVISDTSFTATFGDDARLSGFSGCNQYAANYQVNGSTLFIGDASVTLLSCGMPAGSNEQEMRILALFPSVTSYDVAGGRLVLMNAAGEKLQVLNRQ